MLVLLPGRGGWDGAASTRMFAMLVPGLAPLAARELGEIAGIRVGAAGFDGRSDVLLLEATQPARGGSLCMRLTEDVFVEVGRTVRADGDKPGCIASRIWRLDRVERALSAWATYVSPLRAAMTFRVVTRVLQERSFLRTDLRRELSGLIERDRPRWQWADPAQLEIWITEYVPGRFVAGLRLSDHWMRQHDGREQERRGALRPSVAAAMALLAGRPRGVLLDPCCGSGTILSEALGAGWQVRGADIDHRAVEIAQLNVPAAPIALGDARKLDFPDDAVGACVSNLPFGQQYGIQGDARAWLTAVLGEMTRVTRPAGRVVLLVPEIPRAIVPAGLAFGERFRLRLLGTPTSIWSYARRA
jgi:23S rRNA G2445 N2-methylase RlmL